MLGSEIVYEELVKLTTAGGETVAGRCLELEILAVLVLKGVGLIIVS